MKLKKLALAMSIALGFHSTTALAAEAVQPRAALVMGNADYKEIGALKNPVNDARDMRDTLKSLGFTVVYLENAATRSEMRKAVDEFYDILNNQKGIGLFFYAGHGIQVKEKNYLIPIDAKVRSESDTEDELLSVDKVLGKMEDAKNPLNIIVLDACRNNPFKSRGLFRDIASSRGLAVPTQELGGSIIIYATSANNVAADGSGRNGVYTKHFKEWVKKPGLKIEDVLKGVRGAVKAETRNKQVPFEYGSIDGDFCFVNCPSTDPEEKDKKIVELTEKLTALQATLTSLQTSGGETKPSKKKEALKLQEEIAALQAEINVNDQKTKARSTDSPLSSQEKALQLKQEIEQELAK